MRKILPKGAKQFLIVYLLTVVAYFGSRWDKLSAKTDPITLLIGIGLFVFVSLVAILYWMAKNTDEQGNLQIKLTRSKS